MITSCFFVSDSLIRSFVLSDVSESLTFAHMLWAIWAIRSQSLTSHERPERIAHIRSYAMSNLSHLLTCPEQPERFAHGRSFVLSDQKGGITGGSHFQLDSLVN